MFPFWEIVIAPVIEAVEAKRVLEIGALRGETTELVLDRLGPDAELHVIDPIPAFDPADHEAQFGGRYVFHQDISHNVLPHLPPVDVALIDGDHNWYTVYHELREIAAVARRAGRPLPVLLMHDVCWPYGRRDLYYAPEQIPEEFRQPYEQKGMRPGRKKLLPRGGMNPTMFNAVTEGGKRNGVMTALDDFVAEHDQPLRVIVIPIYFGLAVVVEESRLARQPQLAAVLDRIENAEGRRDLLELAEDTRLRAMIFQHNVLAHGQRQQEQLVRRYLDILKGSLLDEHYCENEVRLRYLAKAHDKGRAPTLPQLREPARHLKAEMRTVEQAIRTGTWGGENPILPFAYADMGRTNLDQLEHNLDTIAAGDVPGDLVECGTRRGGGGIFLRGYLAAHGEPNRQVWVADAFRAAPEGDAVAPTELLDPAGLMPDLAMVRAGFERFDLLDDRVRFLQGPYSDTLADAPIDSVALLRVGADVGEAVGTVLEALYDRLSVGGYVMVDDHRTESSQKAIDAFRLGRGITEQITRLSGSGAMWQKEHHRPSPNGAVTTDTRRRAPLAPPLPTDSCDLSVVVVFYNMGREAARTLQSLTRGYQEAVDELDYEVVVVENGSAEDQRLGDELVRSFGPNFRYIDLGAEAMPSPVNALNRGIRQARGEVIAMMIDGAHVLTPGVLRFAMAGLSTYAPAIVVTQQWYVGPGQQPEALASGYDQDYEDRLFERISWPTDGYRLFEVGHFIGDRDWLDGLWESNCLFAPRSVLEQVGGFDESFSMPGGEYANLELYERLGTTPGVTVVSMLGEGSFHQAHGGTTTNQIDHAERHRRISSYGQHYAEVRGRGFRGTGKPIHYVGTLEPVARRTRGRRMLSPAFRAEAPSVGRDLPDTPVPMPEELREEFVEAYWRTLAWQDTTWLGHPVGKAPTDLYAYQELLTRVRPDWIIETGTGNGGRALFLATICDLLGSGQIVSMDHAAAKELPAHPRITYIRKRPHHAETVQQVLDLVDRDARVLVVLGSRGTPPLTAAEFGAYAPLVPSGSYVVVEETVVNGHPVWAEFGPGPAEGVKRILRESSDFAQDPTFEPVGLSFNRGGFLRRL